MKTINVAISDIEFNKFGLKSTNFSFSDLLDILSREITKQKISDSVEMAEKFGFAKLTITDINKEIKAARKNAKNRN